MCELGVTCQLLSRVELFWHGSDSVTACCMLSDNMEHNVVGATVGHMPGV